MFKVQVTCRSCQASLGSPVLSLGSTPLANALVNPAERGQPEDHYPLELVLCEECSLLQLTGTVSPEVLYRHYPYYSSCSQTLLEHAREVCLRMIEGLQLNQSSFVLEIASNDGYLLQHYLNQGVSVLGIEPAANIAEVARQRGIETLNEFFGPAVVEQLVAEGRCADVIHSHNVLAHIGDLPGVVRGIARLLKPNGLWVIEVPYLLDLVDGNEFDTIYHEHLSYFSVTSIQSLMSSNGMQLVGVERLAIHGGSLRLFVTRQGESLTEGVLGDSASRVVMSDRSVSELLSLEEEWGVGSISTYRRFAANVSRLKSDLNSLLVELKGQGRVVAAYGASAKGATLLNYFGIGKETIDFVVDVSAVKQGFFTPGTQIPILAPTQLLERKPDYVLLLTWNFMDEILLQQSKYREQGGKFIVPIPELQVV